QSGSGPLPSSLYATARKADIIIAPNGSSDDLLALNPISVQQIIPPPTPSASYGPVQLRSLGLTVPWSAPAAPATQSASVTDSNKNPFTQAEVAPLDVDKKPDNIEPLRLDT